MKPVVRYVITIAGGAMAGAALAWTLAGQGMGRKDIVNGPWTTSLGFGTAATDSATRASVARNGLLALPSTEVIYWAAIVDSEGRPLDGSCRYTLTGKALDTRWWSITVYDERGYLMPNPINRWSFNGAAISEAEKAGWRVAIASDKPAAGHWLPVTAGKPFHLTLRMYNPGAGFRAKLDRADLPEIRKEACQ